MRKEQANKPDFVRDINTAIMEELTAGGIKDNAAGLAGELKEVTEVTELCGLPFNGYLAKIETPRPRGTLDEVIVAFTDSKVDVGQQRDGRPLKEFLTAGSKVIVTGAVQTLKDFESGKVLVFILADFLAMVKNPMMQDDVALRGIIAHEPIYRTTPRGKRITDISVIVKNELTGNKCFIPCICWQEQADEVAGWQQGDTVELLGRYQSRQYEKVIDTDSGSRERRTAYEVSVQLINRKGRAGNGKYRKKAVEFSEFALKCPYFDSESEVNNGYGCDHPAQEFLEDDANGFQKGCCLILGCPFGYPATQEDMDNPDAEIDWCGFCEDGQVTELDYLLIDEEEKISFIQYRGKDY